LICAIQQEIITTTTNITRTCYMSMYS